MPERTLLSKTASRLRRMPRFLKRVAIVSFVLVLGIAALLAALVAWPAPEPPDLSTSGDFVIRNVSIIDIETGTAQRGRDVVLRNGMIESIEPVGSGVLTGDATEIDGRGRYLMPGLWDMHTHSNAFAPQFQHPLFVANGVTAVREMWGCMSRPDPLIACAEDRRGRNDAIVDGRGVNRTNADTHK